MKKADPKASVCIPNGYGGLKQCVVGIGNGLENGSGKDWSFLLLDDMTFSEMLEKENDALISVLEGKGTEVLRPERLSYDRIEKAYGRGALRNGLNQAFPRNTYAIVGNDLIEFEPSRPQMKIGMLGLYGILNGKSKDPSICWYSTPHCPLMYTPEDYPCLDGSDFILMDDKMIIGVHESDGFGTNLAGFKWMRNTFAFHDVRAVMLPDSISFLGQVLSVVRPGLAVVCREIVKELPAYMKDWDIIDISAEEAENFAADGITVDAKTYIAGCTDRFSNAHLVSELRNRGIEVHAIDFTAHAELGGSVGSAVWALRRDVPE